MNEDELAIAICRLLNGKTKKQVNDAINKMFRLIESNLVVTLPEEIIIPESEPGKLGGD